MAESTLAVEHRNLAFHLRRTARDSRAENPSFETFQPLVFSSLFLGYCNFFSFECHCQDGASPFLFPSVLGTPASLPRCQDIVYNPASRTLRVLTRRGPNSQDERDLADGPR